MVESIPAKMGNYTIGYPSSDVTDSSDMSPSQTLPFQRLNFMKMLGDG